MATKNNVQIKHTVHGGIIEDIDGNLSGSCHELDISYGQKITNILLDIGDATIDDTNKKNQYSGGPNKKESDSIFVSHSHRDHAGQLASLAEQGYNKYIYMHNTAKEITKVLLADELDKQDDIIRKTNAQFKKNWESLKKANHSLAVLLGVHHTRKTNPLPKDVFDSDRIESIFNKNGITSIKPLSQVELDKYKPTYLKREFSKQDVINTINHIIPKQYGEEFSLIKNFVKAKFYNAGHIQGSVLTLLKIIGDSNKAHSTFNVLYTGDIGRFKDPGKAEVPQTPKEKLDYLVIEGTYGDKLHPDRILEKRRFIDELNHSTGLVLIPCFVLERMQEVREILGTAIDNQQITLGKNEKIYFDSKSGYNISKEYLMADSKNNYSHLKEHPQMEWVREQDSSEEVSASQKILGHKGRCIVVCSGGMGENGSIMEYLIQAMQSRYAKILTTGFQAPGTIGHKILHNNFAEPMVINGKEITKNNASIHSFSFSSHGDQDDLMRFIKQCKLSDDVKITIVHGGEQRNALEAKIKEYLTEQDLKKKKENRGQRKTFVPKKNGDIITI